MYEYDILLNTKIIHGICLLSERLNTMSLKISIPLTVCPFYPQCTLIKCIIHKDNHIT